MTYCPKCKLDKEPTEFGKSIKRKNGLQVYCKPCRLDMQRACPTRKATSARYRNKNKALCIVRTMASYKKKREYYTQKATEWRAANPDKVKQIRKNNRINNRGWLNERERRRKERIREADNLSVADRLEIEGFYQFCKMFPEFEVDHIIPLNGEQVSGLHVPNNLQVLTKRANRIKRNIWSE